MNVSTPWMAGAVGLVVGLGIGLGWNRALDGRGKTGPAIVAGGQPSGGGASNGMAARPWLRSGSGSERRAASDWGGDGSKVGLGEFERMLRSQPNSPDWHPRFLGVLLRLNPAELPEAAALAARLGDSRFGGQALVMVLGRWAEVDPQAAMAMASEAGSRMAREARLHAVLSSWARVDRAGALAWFEQQPEGRAKTEALTALLPGLAESDPETALRMAAEAPAGIRARVLPGVLTTLMQTDPERAAAEVERVGLGWAYHLYGEVAGAWAAKDTQAAETWARGVKSPLARRAALAQVYGAMARQDPEAAFGRLAQETDPVLRQQGRSIILQEVAGRDASELPKYFASIENPAELQSALTGVGWMWGMADRESALKFAQGLPAGQGRSQLLTSVASEWAQTDAAGAVAWASALPSGVERNQVLQSVVMQWAVQDFEAADRYVREMPAGQAKNQFLAQIAMQMDNKDPAVVMKWMKELPAAQRTQAAQHVIHSLSRSDPAAALELLESLPAGAQRRGMWVGQVVNGWAESDLPQAVAWVKGLPDGETKRQALMNLSWRWMETAPQEAVEYATSLPPGRTREQVLGQAASNWGMRDPAAASAWAVGLPEGEARQRALVSVLGAWSSSAPTDAATFVANLPPGGLQTEAALGVAGVWAEQSPQEAMSWIRGFTDPSVKEQAQARVLGTWARNDGEGASDFLRAQPAGHERDVLVTSAINGLAHQDPSQAAALTTLISAESDQRGNAWSQVAGAWAQEDPAAAAQWLGGLPAGGQRDAALNGFVHSSLFNDPSVAATAAALITDPAQRAAAVQMVAGRWRDVDREAAERWLRTVPLPDAALPATPSPYEGQ